MLLLLLGTWLLSQQVKGLEVKINPFGDMQEESHLKTTFEGLDQELNALDEMIILQEKKLKHLAQLRNVLNQNAQSDSDIAKKITNLMDSFGSDGHNTNDFQKISAHIYRDHVVEKAHVSIENGIAAIGITFIRSIKRGDFPLIIVCDMDGTIHFMTDNGDRISSYSIGRSDVQQLVVDLKPKVPQIYLSFSDKTFAIYSFAVWYDNQVIMGNTTMVLPKEQRELSITIELEKIVQTTSVTKDIVLSRVRGKSILAISYKTEDKLEIYSQNGTLLNDFKLNSTADALYPIGNFLALSLNTQIKFLSMDREKFLSNKYTCHGTKRPIVSIATDPVHSNVVYATTDLGDILVFNRRAKSERGVKCRLLYRQTPTGSDRGNQLTLGSTRGYVLSVSKNHFQVHNVSNVLQTHPRYLFHHSHDFMQGKNEKNYEPLLQVTASKLDDATGQNKLIAYTSHRGNQVLAIAAISLPYHEEVFDIGWVRTPILIVCAVGIIAWQVLQRKRSVSPGDQNFMAGMMSRGGKFPNMNIDE